ncbi:extracellular solute-binding protein [Paenibacillus psychroresistens]|uniref:Extracellular solute-binding protein n=1 Tax=Paenibacillus psychroresistens TaxID=1778678 RepID=A0A6B8RV01_9BACL|nr:extracellular solute-binding protein [Paenibacillus psychroresistens]QGQ99584.1 extracellular solute-binding protein [Paenibacillus psychroresistens]
MKSLNGKRFAALALILSMVVVTACTKKEAATNSSAAPATEAPSSTVAASPAADLNPLGKYDPPITLSTVKIFGSTDKFAPGETPEKNIWTDGYLKDLGITMKINWSVVGNEPGGPGEQKMNIAIASNDLPDIIPVNSKQLKQLVDNDMAEDLTAAIDQYASPLLKSFLSMNDGLAVKTSTFGGKVLALPVVAASIDTAAMVWVRKDWLDKLQLPEPKTMNDILAISDAFTNKDPDGNNKKDSFGLGLNKDIYTGGLYDLTGFLEGYHAYRNLWLKGADGKLVYGGIQPEMKTALTKLQEMFKAGQFDPEFGVKDNGKVNESVVSGKIGMFYGMHWNAFYPLPDVFKQDPKAVWIPYPIVSADDKTSIPSIGLGVTPTSVDQGYVVFKKGSKHPEAIVKLANYFADKEYGFETGGVDLNFHQPVPNPENYIRWRFAAVLAQDPAQNINIFRGVKAAVENNDQSVMKNLQVKDNYTNYLKFTNDHDATQYATATWIGPKNSGFSVVDYYLTNKLGVTDQFYGAKTDTMVQKQSTLDKLQLESFTKILMGASPVEAFDKFVEDWKKLGGDAITQEVNDWYTAQK